jgi:hypothetical protein
MDLAWVLSNICVRSRLRVKTQFVPSEGSDRSRHHCCGCCAFSHSQRTQERNRLSYRSFWFGFQTTKSHRDRIVLAHPITSFGEDTDQWTNQFAANIDPLPTPLKLQKAITTLSITQFHQLSSSLRSQEDYPSDNQSSFYQFQLFKITRFRFKTTDRLNLPCSERKGQHPKQSRRVCNFRGQSKVTIWEGQFKS